MASSHGNVGQVRMVSMGCGRAVRMEVMEHSEVARFLSEHGAYATATAQADEWSLLQVVAKEENEETARILIRQEADAIAAAHPRRAA